MLGKKSREVPDYPGQLVRKPPAAPKYLVQVIETEEGTKNQLIQVKGNAPAIRPQSLPEPDLPIQAKYSRIVPQRDHTTPSHFYPPRQEYVPPEMKKKSNKTRNSLVDVKSSAATSTTSSNSSPTSKQSNAPAKDEHHSMFPSIAKNPTIPRPYVPTSSSLYVGGPLMHAREASGKILGTGTTRIVPEQHVPYLPPTTQSFSSSQTITYDISTVGPDNPIQQMNETWSACWDDEAGAVYYYNSQTGEATWISPF